MLGSIGLLQSAGFELHVGVALPMMSVPQRLDNIVLVDGQELAAVWRNEAFM